GAQGGSGHTWFRCAERASAPNASASGLLCALCVERPSPPPSALELTHHRRAQPIDLAAAIRHEGPGRAQPLLMQRKRGCAWELIVSSTTARSQSFATPPGQGTRR